MSALRVSVPGQPPRLIRDFDEADLTPRQREVVATVRSVRGNRSRAARLLGCHVVNVQVVLRAAKARGARVPPGARRGPDLSPRAART